MRFNEAVSGLKRMSKDILSDGRIDVEEARKLKEFIYPYVLNGNKPFVELNKLIDRCLEDGEITKEESDRITSFIEETLVFLKIDNLACIVVLSLFIGLIAVMFGFCVFG